MWGNAREYMVIGLKQVKLTCPFNHNTMSLYRCGNCSLLPYLHVPCVTMPKNNYSLLPTNSVCVCVYQGQSGMHFVYLRKNIISSVNPAVLN